jgi:hypothetical protein
MDAVKAERLEPSWQVIRTANLGDDAFGTRRQIVGGIVLTVITFRRGNVVGSVVLQTSQADETEEAIRLSRVLDKRIDEAFKR